MPEIADGIVELKACAREPGHRTKIAVWSNDTNVDPVGACVGARGARVRQVVNELNGEKIDIVPFSDDPYDFVMKALSPAKVKEVRIDVETGTATVIVPDFQLSLAIGKEGQNARLAARLTGWRVDIKSETQLADEEAYQGEEWAQGEWVVDPESGEQVWVPAEGGPALSAEEWAHAGDEPEDGEHRRSAATPRRRGRGGRRAGGRRAATEADEPEAEPEAERRRPEEEPTDASDAASRQRRSADGDTRMAEARRPEEGRQPRRTCVGCRRQAGQDELVRVVRRPDGTVAGRPYTARPGGVALRRVPQLPAASRPPRRPLPGVAGTRVRRSRPGPGLGGPRMTAPTGPHRIVPTCGFVRGWTAVDFPLKD